MHPCGSGFTPHPLFAPCTRRGWGYWTKKTQNLSALEDHLCAKFHCNPSSGLDFYREQTHRQKDIAFLVSRLIFHNVLVPNFNTAIFRWIVHKN